MRNVGIRDLKDRASSIVQQVVRSKRAVVITRNNKKVARIVPLGSDVNEALADQGLVVRDAAAGFDDLVLVPLRRDASGAITALASDRDD